MQNITIFLYDIHKMSLKNILLPAAVYERILWVSQKIFEEEMDSETSLFFSCYTDRSS